MRVQAVRRFQLREENEDGDERGKGVGEREREAEEKRDGMRKIQMLFVIFISVAVTRAEMYNTHRT